MDEDDEEGGDAGGGMDEGGVDRGGIDRNGGGIDEEMEDDYGDSEDG